MKVLICDFPQMSCRPIATPNGQADLTPAWSPDGRFITFARGTPPALVNGDNFEVVAGFQESLSLWIARADGNGQERLNAPGGSYPTWSDDGRQIYFVHGGKRWIHDLYSDANIDTGVTIPGALGRGWITYSTA